MKASAEDGVWGIPTIPETEHVVRRDGTRGVFKNLSQPIKVLVFFIFILLRFLLLPTYFISESLLNDHHTVSVTEKFSEVNSWNQADQKTLTFAKELTTKFYVSKWLQQSPNSQPQGNDFFKLSWENEKIQNNGLESSTIYEVGTMTLLGMKLLHCSAKE